MKVSVFWNITLHSVVEMCRRFGGSCYIYFQKRRVHRARKDGQLYGELRAMTEAPSGYSFLAA